MFCCFFCLLKKGLLLDLASLSIKENDSTSSEIQTNYISICISKQIAANETVACQIVIDLNKQNKKMYYILI